MRSPSPALRRATRPGAVALLLATAACGGERPQRAIADSALARDLSLATSPTPPLPGDVPAFGDTAVGGPSTAPPRAAEAPAPVAPRAEAPPRPTPTRATAAEPPAPPVRRAPTRVATRPTAPAEPAESADPVETSEVVAPAPAAAPAAAAGRARGPALGVGTVLAARTEQRICSETNRPGDKLVATLTSDATGADGAVLRAGGEGGVELMARGVTIDGEFRPVAAEVSPPEGQAERRTIEGTSDAKGKAVKGAIAGAIIGQILGRSTRGTVAGGAIGGAIGAAAGAAGTKHESCLPAGATVRVRLTEALAVRS